MRILILANVPPGSVGGAEVQALHLARHWAGKGHQITIAGHANSPHQEENLKIFRIATLRHNRLLRGATYAIATFWLLWSQRRKYDLIYCRFLKEQALIAAAAKLILRIRQPLIACPASAGVGGEATLIEHSPFRSLLLWVLRHGVNCINTTSSRIRSELAALNLEGPRFSHIPNGVVVPSTPPTRNTNRLSKPNLVFVGRLTSQKGLDVLIEAARLLRDEEHRFKISIIGDGPLRRELETRSNESHLENHVEFLGNTSPAQIPSHLSHADLFVLPSRYEGMSGALIEALAHGLPAIATSCSGSEDIIDESIGWLIPPENHFALAEAIRTAISLEKDELHKMGIRAWEKTHREFNIVHIAERYEMLFRELLQSHSPNHHSPSGGV